MNIFKKLSIKYFNGHSDLQRDDSRELLTGRDKAFIYACKKYNIKFETYNFFSEIPLVEESDFESEYSLIKCKFSELKKYNHFEWFVYLLCLQLDKERIPQFKAILKLIDGKKGDYFKKIVDTMRSALSNNYLPLFARVVYYTSLWSAGLNDAIIMTAPISILWDNVDSVLNRMFYEIPEAIKKKNEQERIRKQKEQEDYIRRQREWQERLNREAQEQERKRQEEERIRQENARQRARYGYYDYRYSNARAGYNWENDYNRFGSQSDQWENWWNKHYKDQQEAYENRQQSKTTQSSQSISDYSLYKILQIEPTRDKKLIKAAYRKLVLIYHPDKGGNEEKFKELTAAYEKLIQL